MKKFGTLAIAAIAAIVLLGLVGCNRGGDDWPEHVPRRPPNFGTVYDGTGIISNATRNYINSSNDVLAFYTGGEVAFVAVHMVPMGQDLQSFAMDIFNTWELGSYQTQNGILVVLEVLTGEFWIMTGRGIDMHLTRAALDALADTYFVPYFDEARYDEAVRQLFGALVDWLWDFARTVLNLNV